MRVIALVGILFLGGCASIPSTWTYEDGSTISFTRAGCKLNVVFQNNSNSSVDLSGHLIVTSTTTNEVLDKEYVSWRSNTVPAGSIVRGTAGVGADGDELESLAVNGFACSRTTYENKITYSYQ
jgi:hypothetical protein